MKNMLVVVEDSTAADVRLDAACEMASRFGAHLTVLAVGPSPLLSYGADMGGSAQFISDEIDAARARIESAAERARRRLEAREVKPDIRLVSEIAPDVSRQAARHARYADITFTGQPDPDALEPTVLAAIDGVLFDSGRPLVMIPNHWSGAGFGKRILLAWDGSERAARVSTASLPLLVAAEQVTVAVVEPDVGASAHGEEPGADIAVSLARNGAKVQVEILASAGRSTSQTLLRCAHDHNCNLIAMGAYGHTRMREAWFGGVTREMLDGSDTPLFLMH